MAITATKRAPPPPSSEEKEKFIVEVWSYPIWLSERIREAVSEAESLKSECFSVQNLAEKIEQMLCCARTASATSPRSFYPFYPFIRRTVAEVSRNFEKTITLVRKCRRRRFLPRFMTMTIVSAADFRKLLFLLDISVARMEWLLSSHYGGGGALKLRSKHGYSMLLEEQTARTDPQSCRTFNVYYGGLLVQKPSY